MKIIPFLLALLLFASCKDKDGFANTPRHPSAVDALESKASIEAFIRKSDTNYKKYELKHLQDFDRTHGNDSINNILANKHNVKTNFIKVDFDNNGYTDFLAIGDNHTCYGSGEKSCSFSPIVLMNYGTETKIFPIDLEWDKSIVPTVEYIHSKPFLVVYSHKFDWKKESYSELKSILTFKYGGFIEYNEHPKKNKISKIEFSTSGCFGTCPVYKLTLSRDSLSVFNARYYNFNEDRDITYGKEEGVFLTMINKKGFDELEEIINYCDFENLNSDYSVMHTDDQTGHLKITFNDGKTKMISDYGMIGTYGLKLLYKKLAELRFSEKWRKSNGTGN